MTGQKFDNGKSRWDLVPWDELCATVNVLTDGAKVYGDGNWQQVDNAKNRYFAAMLRHISAWRRGQRTDPKSGHHHMAHVACNAFFLMWFDGRDCE